MRTACLLLALALALAVPVAAAEPTEEDEAHKSCVSTSAEGSFSVSLGACLALVGAPEPPL